MSDVVQPSAVPADAVRRTLWVSTFEGCATAVFFNWTMGSVLTGYILFLGGGPRSLAAVASIPLLVGMFGPVWAWVATRLGRRMRFVAGNALVARPLWLVIAAVPLFGLPATAQLGLVLGLIFVSHFFQASTVAPWMAVMADVVPENIRGRYFGARTAICGLVSVLAGLAAGMFIDRMPRPAAFQTVFAAAVAFALVGIWLYGRYHDPPTEHARVSLAESLALPFRDRAFRRFMTYTACWNAAVYFGSPFVIPYFLQHLKMSFTQVALWSLLGSLSAMVMGPVWGRIADRVGHRTVLIVTSTLAGTILPLAWLLAGPDRLGFIWFAALLESVTWAAITPAMFSLTLAGCPAAHRMGYLAAVGLVNGLAGFASGMLSGQVMNVLPPEIHILGITWTRYHSILLATALFRVAASRLVWLIQEPDAWLARDLIRALVVWPLDQIRGWREE